MNDHIKYHFDIFQGTDEWLKLKMGVLSASEFKKIITPANLKLSSSQDAKAHYDDILAQRIDPTLQYNYMSDDMMRGHDDEPYAIEVYEEKYDRKVKNCGFITNSEFGGTIGYSPDGLVGDDGLIEIKSRSPKLQTKTILDHIAGRTEDLIPKDYMMQVQSGLLISGRKWTDFISYCNGHPMVCIRVYPISEIIDAIRASVSIFELALQQNLIDYNKAVENDFRLTKTVRREIQEMSF